MPSKPFEMTLEYGTVALVAGSDFLIDIPTEPISYLDFILTGINPTDTGEELSIEDVLSQIDLITIKLNGADIISLTGEECAIYAMAVSGFLPTLTFEDDDAGQAFTLVFRIPFSRIPYNPNECYPATPRGNSKCRIQVIGAFTKVTNMDLTVVACRLPGATPPVMVAQDMIQETLAAIGTYDIDLTKQFPLVGLLMWSSQIPNSTVETAVIDQLSLFIGSDQTRLHDMPWCHLRGRLMEKMRNFGLLREHAHKLIEVAYAQGDSTSPQLQEDDSLWDHYAYVDFDPLLDGQHILRVKPGLKFVARVITTIAGYVHFIPVILRDTSDMVAR